MDQGVSKLINDLFISADYNLKNRQYNDAINCLNTIVTEHDPKCAKAWTLYAEIKLTTGHPLDALEALAEVEPPLPALGSTFPAMTAQVLILKAKSFFSLKRWDDCRSALVGILNFDKDNPEALEIFADLLVELNRPLEAIRLYKNLLKEKYDVVNVLYSLCLAYDKAGESEWALHYAFQLKDGGHSNQAVEDVIKSHSVKVFRKIASSDKSLTWLDTVAARLSPDQALGKVKNHVSLYVNGGSLVGHTYIDALTGLYNKDALGNVLPRLKNKALEPLFLCRLDIDHFRSIIDVYGQDVAEEVLKGLGHLLSESFPEHSFRTDQDDFLWVFQGPKDQALLLSKRIRETVEVELWKTINEFLETSPIRDFEDNHYRLLWPITISQGLTLWETGSFEQAIHDADNNLFQAKQSLVGRNAIFFGLSLVEKGNSPIRYSRVIIAALNHWAIGRQLSSWWEALPVLDGKLKAEALRLATSREKEIHSKRSN